MLQFYRKARKAVHGALASVVPVLIVCDNTNASAKATVLACAAALLGVGTVTYATKKNEPA